jgi:hypothetical protein
MTVPGGIWARRLNANQDEIARRDYTRVDTATVGEVGYKRAEGSNSGHVERELSR